MIAGTSVVESLVYFIINGINPMLDLPLKRLKLNKKLNTKMLDLPLNRLKKIKMRWTSH